MPKTPPTTCQEYVLNPPKSSVHRMYTDEVVIQIVQAKKASKMSLRQISSEYGHPITHADIQRILEGILPASVMKRLCLGLPPICPHCDQIIHRRKKVPAWVSHAAYFLRAQEQLTHGTD